MSKNCQKLGFFSNILPKNFNFFRKNCQWQFFEKNEYSLQFKKKTSSFWQFCWKKMTIFVNFFKKQCQVFGNFVEKNDKFSQCFWKQCQVFGNFLTFKWQFSGGSGVYLNLVGNYLLSCKTFSLLCKHNLFTLLNVLVYLLFNIPVLKIVFRLYLKNVLCWESGDSLRISSFCLSWNDLLSSRASDPLKLIFKM